MDNQKERLHWSIGELLLDICELDDLVAQELREYERCTERFPEDVPRAAADLAVSLQAYRQVTRLLGHDVSELLSLAQI